MIVVSIPALLVVGVGGEAYLDRIAEVWVRVAHHRAGHVYTTAGVITHRELLLLWIVVLMVVGVVVEHRRSTIAIHVIVMLMLLVVVLMVIRRHVILVMLLVMLVLMMMVVLGRGGGGLLVNTTSAGTSHVVGALWLFVGHWYFPHYSRNVDLDLFTYEAGTEHRFPIVGVLGEMWVETPCRGGNLR